MDGGNDYLIQVKKNQPKLFKRIEELTNEDQPLDTCSTEDLSRGRKVNRYTEVYGNSGGFDKGWIKLERIIKQTRSGKRGKKNFEEIHYYISSKERDDASYFAEGIRSHWGIENRSHWVRDVVMNEDGCRIKSKEIVSNLSLFRSAIISLFRANGHDSITRGIEIFTNKMEMSMELISKKHIYDS